MAAAGGDYSVLLRDDGQAVAFGNNANQRCKIPALPAATPKKKKKGTGKRIY